jgi:hypothetical protein
LPVLLLLLFIFKETVGFMKDGENAPTFRNGVTRW